MKSFNIKTARVQAGLLQSQMAREIGVSSGTYSSIENYNRILNVQEAYLFSEVVGISMDQIIFFGNETEHNRVINIQRELREA